MRSSLVLCSALLLSVLGLTALTGPASAQSSRIYFAGYMGLNTPLQSEFSESTTPASGDIEYKNDVSFAGALGLRLDHRWRLEGELSYRNSDLSDITINGAGNFKLDGEMKTWLMMANLYYDIDLEWQNLEPFVTAGIGLASHEGTINDSSGFTTDASDSALGIAWQVGGGLKYRVTPDLAFTGGYRYLATTDIELDSYDLDYSSHEIRFGLEYDIPVDLFQ